MHIFRELKKITGTNEKLSFAIGNFTEKHFRYMNVCFNFQVYGISGAGIKKAIKYDKDLFGKTEDLGEYLEKLAKTDMWDKTFENTLYNLPIEELVDILMKSSGNDQINKLNISLCAFTKEEMPWVIRAISKNMRFGFSLSSYNKVRIARGLNPIETKGVQLCGKIYADNLTGLEYPRFAEIKYDGERCLPEIKKANGIVSVKLTSRGNTDITDQYPEVVNKFKLVADKMSDNSSIVYDCEIVSSSFDALSKRMHRKKENIGEEDKSIRAVMFDIVSINGLLLNKMTHMMTQSDRRVMLERRSIKYDFDISKLIVVNNEVELLAFYKKALENKEEGAVTKDLDMIWTPHSRDGWYKMVPVENLDLKIVDCYYGNGKFANQINGIIVENKDGTIRSKASSGIKNFERELLTSLHDKNELIGRIAEISFREKQAPKNGVSSLRFPVFKRIREDKFESD